MHRIILLVCISFIALTIAHSEETKQYKIELILFTPSNSQHSLSEHGSSEEQWPKLEQAVELSLDPEQSHYLALSSAEMNLSDIGYSLERSPHFKVLQHLVWRQPGFNRNTASPIHVSGGADLGIRFPARMPLIPITPGFNRETTKMTPPTTRPLNQFDGTVKIALERYLHIYTDIIFRHPTLLSEEQEGDQEVEPTISLVDYRIRAHRRMRSQELHYLDHPLLGILVQITPLSGVQ